ncbi:MAG: DUF2849 domain-containing protein [Gammaproteobacteria bacterium]
MSDRLASVRLGDVEAMQQIIIANSLRDGRVVFLREDQQWSEQIADACVVTSTEEAERVLAVALQAETANAVIDPYLIDVEDKNGELRPTVYREYIRACGPVVHGHPGENDN